MEIPEHARATETSLQPTTGMRERKRLQTRERIYRAAVELIVEQGFESTTMDDIATRADAARRTVFNHFPSKGDITHEWADRRRTRAARSARNTVGVAGTVIDRLRAFFRELVVITEEAPQETRQMLLGWLSAHGPVYNSSWMPEELQSWIDDGRDEGAVSDVVAPTIAADALYDVYLGVLFRWMRDDVPVPGQLEVNLGAVIDLVLAGLQPGSSDSRSLPAPGVTGG